MIPTGGLEATAVAPVGGGNRRRFPEREDGTSLSSLALPFGAVSEWRTRKWAGNVRRKLRHLSE